MVTRMCGGDSKASGHRCAAATHPGGASALYRDRRDTRAVGWLLAGLVAAAVIAMSAGAMSAGAVPALRLRIDRSIVAAADKAAVGAAITAAHARAHSPGLPDAVHPSGIDPAQAEAVLSALLQPSGDAGAPLSG